jgi:hypothetical protein
MRRLKRDNDMYWCEVTESGRLYARRLQSGDYESMAKRVAEQQENRLRYIRRLHEVTNGPTAKEAGADIFALGSTLGFSEELTREIVRFFQLFHQAPYISAVSLQSD